MDLMRFNPSLNGALLLKNAELVEDWDSLIWIERYRDAGEFTVIGPLESNLKEKLPIGSYVSHVDSDDLMIVENHELSEDADNPSVLTVTGRSWESFLEQRVVGANRPAYPPPVPPVTIPPPDPPVFQYPFPEVILYNERSWEQAKELIRDCVDVGRVFNANDGINGLDIVSSVTLGLYELPTEDRVAAQGELYKEVLSILEIDDLGLRCVRNRVNGRLKLEIHRGINRASSVGFSYEHGDIQSADYLWSNKFWKTDVFVQGKWVDVRVNSNQTGLNKRMAYVDAKDIDDRFAEPFGRGNVLGDAVTIAVEQKMTARGKQELKKRKKLAISNVKINPNVQTKLYREDYKMGDIVGVDGNYNSSTQLRVIEYVEMEDENGKVGYPTLAEVS